MLLTLFLAVNVNIRAGHKRKFEVNQPYLYFLKHIEKGILFAGQKISFE